MSNLGRHCRQTTTSFEYRSSAERGSHATPSACTVGKAREKCTSADEKEHTHVAKPVLRLAPKAV